MHVVQEMKKSKSSSASFPVKILLGVTLSEIGGAQRVVFDLLSSLPEEQYDITLVTSPGGELIHWIDELNKKRKSEIKIIQLSSIRRELSPFYDIKAVKELYKLIKKEKYDIVHFHSSKMGILGRVASYLAGIKNIYFTVHGWGINDDMSKIKKSILGAAERLASRLSTQVICVSQHNREKGIRNGWIKEANSCVIHNGIQELAHNKGKLKAELGLREDVPIIGMVARLTEPKDPMFTIEVINELKKRGKKCRLVIIGDGPMREQCQSLIEEHQLQEQVTLLGSREDARSLLSDMWVFTLFSKWEGLPICILEAMAEGLPVVASKVGGIAELIEPGVNGYLLGQADVMEAADYIEELLSNNSLRESMGARSKEIYTAKFTKDRMVEDYQALYMQGYSLQEESSKEVLSESAVALQQERNKGIDSKKNFSWLLAGNVFNAGSRGALLVILAKMGMPADVGIFSTALSINTPIFMLADLDLRTILATDSKNQYSFSDYAALRMHSCLFSVCISFIVALILTVFFNLSIVSALVIVVMAVAKSLEALSDLILGLLQKNRSMEKIGKSLIIKAILSCSMMAVIFYITKSVVLATVGLALSWATVLVLYDICNARMIFKQKLVIDYKAIKGLFKTSLPMGIVLMIWSLNLNIPNYFIGGYLGSDELGYFSSMFHLVIASDIIVNSLMQSELPSLAGYYWEGRRKSFFKTLKNLVLIACFLGTAGVLISSCCGKHILAILFREDYAVRSRVFTLLMLAYAVQYINICLNNSITAARLLKVQPYIYIVALIGNLIANIILVPRHGLYGAAYAVVISAVIQLVGNGAINYSLYKNFTRRPKDLSNL